MLGAVRTRQPDVDCRSPAGAGAVGAGAGFGGAFVAMTLGAILAGIWILYRVVRGWLALREGKAMHV